MFFKKEKRDKDLEEIEQLIKDSLADSRIAINEQIEKMKRMIRAKAGTNDKRIEKKIKEIERVNWFIDQQEVALKEKDGVRGMTLAIAIDLYFAIVGLTTARNPGKHLQKLGKDLKDLCQNALQDSLKDDKDEW